MLQQQQQQQQVGLGRQAEASAVLGPLPSCLASQASLSSRSRVFSSLGRESRGSERPQEAGVWGGQCGPGLSLRPGRGCSVREGGQTPGRPSWP